MMTRIAALTTYILLCMTFVAATFLSTAEKPLVTASSTMIEKTGRLGQDRPQGFVMERFAG